MKNFKKIIALLIAMVMVLGMSMSVLADDPTVTDQEETTYTIKITTPEGHTYEVFQVFTGTPDATTANQLNNLKYGSNTSKTAGAPVTQEDLETLLALGSAQNVTGTDAQTLIDTLETFVDFESDPIVTTVESTTATEGLAPGYYVIRDIMSEVPEDEGATLYMFQIVNDDLELEAKSDKPSSDKKVDDVNDSDGTEELLQTSADYDIGDEVPYTLTFTLPSDYANYEHYYVKFYDDMCEGLTYKEGSAQIAYGDADAVDFEDPDEADSEVYDDGKQYTWEIIDLKADGSDSANLEAGNTITITYKAVLNSAAVVGLPGNPNQYNVEFSNNPNNTGDGTSKPDDTGKTPVAITFVLTYETVFNKVDENGDAITGADFELYKFIADEEADEDEDLGEKGTWVLVTELGSDFHPTKATSDSGDVEDAVFTFTGLDDGTYKLVETETPDGYNAIDDVIFEITAAHTVTGGTLSLTSLTGTDGDEFTLTADTDAGTLTGDVENQSGAILPSTGGIGTTIFYLVGAILVLGAAVMLVTKRRMSAN